MVVRLFLVLALVAVAAWRFWPGDGLAGLTPIAENACGDSAVISWEPEAPRQGALFRVRVSRVPEPTRPVA